MKKLRTVAEAECLGKVEGNSFFHILYLSKSLGVHADRTGARRTPVSAALRQASGPSQTNLLRVVRVAWEVNDSFTISFQGFRKELAFSWNIPPPWIYFYYLIISSFLGMNIPIPVTWEHLPLEPGATLRQASWLCCNVLQQLCHFGHILSSGWVLNGVSMSCKGSMGVISHRIFLWCLK